MNRRSDAVSSVRAQRKRNENRMVAYVRVHASEREKERKRERMNASIACMSEGARARGTKKRRESSYSERR